MLLLFSQIFDQVISKSSYLSVFIIDDNTKVGPRYRQEYRRISVRKREETGRI